jgi:REP element-mobilizing transposase RayT
MARPLRIEYSGAFYHIINRGNAQGKIFLNNRDREKFLEYLEVSVERFPLIVHSYCLMDNHYHLLVETPEANISKAMRWLNASYAVYFNIKRNRSGHLFQGRFKAIIVNADEYLHVLSRYIHLNPVRAKLANKPEDYKWSSYNALIGKVKEPKWLEMNYLLSHFHKTQTKAMQLFQKYCQEDNAETLKNPSKDAVQGFILGGAHFVKWIQEKLLSSEFNEKNEKEISQLRKIKLRPTVEKVVEEVGKEFGSQAKDILRTGKKRNRARETAIYLSQLHTGLTGKEIGEYFGHVSGARISMVLKKIKSDVEANTGFKNVIEKLAKRIVNN